MTLLSAAVALASVVSAAETSNRVAVLVGSNQAAPARSALRYAHSDVRNMADVLVQVGGFPPSDVHLLLDPESDQLLRLLDETLGSFKQREGETLLLFYYSGHADDRSLYVRGQPLPLEELRRRLDRTDSTVRVGVVDACRGGAWTRAKGLTPEAPFEVEIPLKLASEGSVLISSSSGLENAHEAESLRGSFFTHHLVAGLRGAADASGDGVVTLNEAYAYAKERTVRDTALSVEAPQHPSFSMNLRGRSDLPLTVMSNSSTVVAIEERRGPLQLIHLGTGLKVLEVPEGERRVLLALAPGKYVLRRKEGATVFAREFTVAANQSLTVEEASLTVDGSEHLVAKGPPELHASVHTTMPARTVELAVGGGMSHSTWPGPTSVTAWVGNVAWVGSFSWGITDRLQWPILRPALTYRWGDRPGREWVLTGGLLGWGYSNVEAFIYMPGLHLDFRQWLGERHSLNAGVQVTTQGSVGGSISQAPNNWFSSVSVGYSHFLHERVTLNLAVSWHRQAFRQGSFVLFDPGLTQAGVLSIGSVQTMGLRPLPLVQLHLGRVFSLFGDVSVAVHLPTGILSERYMFGASWAF